MVDTQSGSTVREAASQMSDQVVEQGGDLKEAATEHLGALAGEAKEQVRTVFDEARQEIGRQLDEQGQRLGGSVRQAAEQLRSMAGSSEPGMVSDVARQLGDALARLSDTVEREGVEGVANDVRAFARRQPGLFLIGAGVAGFVAARLLRSGAMRLSNGSSEAAGSASDGATGNPRHQGGSIGAGVTPGALPGPDVIPAPDFGSPGSPSPLAS